MIDQLETTIQNASGTIDAVRANIQQVIFNALRPSGRRHPAQRGIFD
jgi:hypothetical protein